MLELPIITMHQTLVDDLNAAGIDGVRAKYTPSMAYDTAEEHIIELVVFFANSVAAKLAADWLSEYLKRKPPRETTINKQTVSNNAENVVIIINNFIDSEGKEKKD